MKVLPSSTSKKSDSGYSKLPRLSRTLKRKPVFRDFQPEDLKYLWVAYKHGLIQFPEGLEPKEFDEMLLSTMDNEYEFGWTMMGDTHPVGFLFGSIAGPFVLLRDATWLPHATSRNKVEHIVNIVNILRKSMKLVFTSGEKDKDFYLYVARHGITRRVGHINDLDQTYVLWESRWQAR